VPRVFRRLDTLVRRRVALVAIFHRERFHHSSVRSFTIRWRVSLYSGRTELGYKRRLYDTYAGAPFSFSNPSSRLRNDDRVRLLPRIVFAFRVRLTRVRLPCIVISKTGNTVNVGDWVRRNRTVEKRRKVTRRRVSEIRPGGGGTNLFELRFDRKILSRRQ